MQINPSQRAQAEIIRDVPPRLLASLPPGQTVEATVVARLSADKVQIQLGEQKIVLNTRQALEPGQQIQLERTQEAGKPVIKISAASAERLPPVNLSQGQQVAVEVIKLLAQQRVLVAPLAGERSDNAPAVRLPQQIEIDVSALKQRFVAGDKLMLQVLREQPLAVALKAAPPQAKEQLIQSYQRELLPQFKQVSPGFNALNRLTPQQATILSPQVSQAVDRLWQGVMPSQNLQQAAGVRQAISDSGVFLENRLKPSLQSPPQSINQDFKANLLQLAQTLKTTLAHSPNPRLVDDPEMMQKLPVEVRQALRQLLDAPQQLRNLPTQVPPALASRGQTPMQLLLGLLSGLVNQSQSPTSTQQTASSSSAVASAPQAAVQANNTQTQNANQAAARAIEWHMLRDLLREVESASARIQYNQLSMLRDSDNSPNANVWLFDVPVKDKQQLDMLQMRFEQRRGGENGDSETIWQVQLNLETRNLGPMQARISLFNDDVKVLLLAERADAAAHLTAHIDALAARLDELGVSVSQLSSRQGMVKPLTSEPQMGEDLPAHLVDISI
jgi:hypothetical protein